MNAPDRAEYGLDQPVVTQFRRYVGRLAHGDLGQSYSYSVPVMGTALALTSVHRPHGSWPIRGCYRPAAAPSIRRAMRKVTQMPRRLAMFLIIAAVIIVPATGCSDKGDGGKNGSSTTVASPSQGD